MSVITPTVGVVRAAAAEYPRESPFHPSSRYPEYPFGGAVADEPNHAYAAVRDLLHTLDLDAAHYDTSDWNPLGELVRPGMTVVIKPNFVQSRHKQGGDLWAVITHPSVLRAVADYCWIALKGSGRLVIADAPQYDCNFDELRAAAGLDALQAFYDAQDAGRRGPSFEIRDLRTYWSNGRHQPSDLRPLAGDPEGSVRVNLGPESLLRGTSPRKLYGAMYRRDELRRHHVGDVQAYDLAGTMTRADVVISVPKLKVHKKVGVTLNAKGLVGVCTNKNLLVHYTLTPPSKGGDQYPDGHFTRMEESLIRLERWMYDHLLAPERRPLEYLHRSMYWLHGRLLKPLGLGIPRHKRVLDAGNWHGNDSAWRMTADLMTAFHFADADGQLRATPQRRLFSIVDGIVGGENQGPLVPDPRPAGVLIGGANLLAVDLVAARLMGLDPRRMRLYAALLDGARDFGVRDLRAIEVRAGVEAWRTCMTNERDAFLGFKPHPGWIAHIEAGETNGPRPQGRGPKYTARGTSPRAQGENAA
ncbi:MAG: DUF362 domain-containing protein [Acidobacteria bacterium]|nr:DUF362 domain-containing protein [Acidobacteriota bacterium]